MSDDQNHEGHDHELHGFSIPLPPGLGAALGELSGRHDRAHMESDLVQQQIYDLLDSLSVEQLMTMRRMFALDAKSTMNNYFEGMVVTVLRLLHHVDPDSGLTPVQAAEQAGKA